MQEQFIREMYWIANYEGGSKLMQFENGKENKYGDIDREKLERFDMVESATDKIIYSMYLRDGQKLIYRRRTLKRLDGTPDAVIYLVGWQMTMMTNSGPRSIKVINYFHPDGSIALDGDRDNLELLSIEQ
jgi:hypothetical protein